ncbi:type II toxin-antitoxin system RatA family toxin [Halalkalirubrum salinum]|uniref:type II toxin-antitoxin system RatA family toxin n=1 Tax=Halalkalirubrum salinum TaxID=2563889 RepID=UPI0010FAD22D|nr:SRPBCC family protein [Halalkalirubrum salinum]
MDELTVSTIVFAPPERIYELLIDFPRYDRYTEYLERVRRMEGDGGPGTRYALRFSWWKITYTAHSQVTDVEPPGRIDWRITKDIDANGCWRIEPLDSVPEDAPAGTETATRVSLEVNFDPHSADADSLDLPRFVNVGWVVEKATPLIRQEAERVFERAIADIEGQRRSIDLEVQTDSDRL